MKGLSTTESLLKLDFLLASCMPDLECLCRLAQRRHRICRCNQRYLADNCGEHDADGITQVVVRDRTKLARSNRASTNARIHGFSRALQDFPTNSVDVKIVSRELWNFVVNRKADLADEFRWPDGAVALQRGS